VSRGTLVCKALGLVARRVPRAFDYITKPLDLKYLERSLWTKIMLMTL
jgi:hypothetical protein